MPQEYRPRIRTLDFLADLYRREHSLASLDKHTPVRVEFIDRMYHTVDGNTRCIFYLLNGIETVSGASFPELDDKDVTKVITADLISKGIKSFRDLVAMVEKPGRYVVRRW